MAFLTVSLRARQEREKGERVERSEEKGERERE